MDFLCFKHQAGDDYDTGFLRYRTSLVNTKISITSTSTSNASMIGNGKAEFLTVGAEESGEVFIAASVCVEAELAFSAKPGCGSDVVTGNACDCGVVALVAVEEVSETAVGVGSGMAVAARSFVGVSDDEFFRREPRLEFWLFAELFDSPASVPEASLDEARLSRLRSRPPRSCTCGKISIGSSLCIARFFSSETGCCGEVAFAKPAKVEIANRMTNSEAIFLMGFVPRLLV